MAAPASSTKGHPGPKLGHQPHFVSSLAFGQWKFVSSLVPDQRKFVSSFARAMLSNSAESAELDSQILPI